MMKKGDKNLTCPFALASGFECRTSGNVETVACFYHQEYICRTSRDFDELRAM